VNATAAGKRAGPRCEGRPRLRGSFDHPASDQEHLARGDRKSIADVLPRDSKYGRGESEELVSVRFSPERM